MENEPLNQVTAQEARTQLSDLINRAVYARQSTLITRQGKPVAVLVSFEEWKQTIGNKAPSAAPSGNENSITPKEDLSDDGTATSDPTE